MARFFVSGLVNVETTCKVAGFPIPYAPVHYPFHGVRSTISGVAVNVAYALHALGDEVRAAALVGRDDLGAWARRDFRDHGVDDAWVLPQLAATPQSVILYDGEGRRQINVDLKDVQQTPYPEERCLAGLDGVDVAVLCNIEFSRPWLSRARALGRTVASDVHCLSDLHDPYNADFMRHAQVLFMSDEHLPDPRDFVRRVAEAYGNDVIVCGLGAQGALLHVRGEGLRHLPAAPAPRVVSTIGAGDALFSAFLHGYARLERPVAALEKAMRFAAHKIGYAGAAEGFLTAAELDAG